MTMFSSPYLLVAVTPIVAVVVQSFEMPDFTSPPLEEALLLTPTAFREDDAIAAQRRLAASGDCGNATLSPTLCQIPFGEEDSKIGILLYGAALVDPRGYAHLATKLSKQFLTLVPIFEKDMAWGFGSCDSGRLQLAKKFAPQVDQWILVGHSFGGISASVDAWAHPKEVAGLVMMAADIRQDLGCGAMDFYSSGLPMAALTASNDGNLNLTRWQDNRPNMAKDTFFVEIEGGNHAGFASYNDSDRGAVLGKVDGPLEISRDEQQERTVQAIVQVAEMANKKRLTETFSQPSENETVMVSAADYSSPFSWLQETFMGVVQKATATSWF